MMLKFSQFIRKYLPIFVSLSIVLGLIAGKLFSETVGSLKSFIPITLFLMLYPMMINVKIEEIKYALTNFKIVASAVLMNFVISPLLGALFAHIFLGNLNPQLLAGFILILTVPCSGMVVAWTGFAKGRIETALSIVALSFILAIFLIPLWMLILVGSYIEVDFWMMFQKLLVMIVLPLIAGLATRKFLIRKIGVKRFLEITPIFPAISCLGMYAIVFIAMALQSKIILANPSYILMIALGIISVYSILFIISILYSKFVGFNYRDTIALGYAVTAKNNSITIALAITTFGGLSVVPPAFATIIQILMMLIILRLATRIEKFIEKPHEREA
ncbi:arsenic resistance protein [Candidatus Bathyarchaeota archaeon]|nr:arsenic resistance protein [Candidatus Bathyarchaeota archaeon]